MAYVDLNPVRVKMADTPEASGYTSAKKRIQSLSIAREQPASLMPFIGNPTEPMPKGLPFNLTDYLELLDWTGKIIRSDKRGAISGALPLILDLLDITPNEWLVLTTRLGSEFKGLVGCVDKLKKAAKKLGYQRTPGISICKAVFT